MEDARKTVRDFLEAELDQRRNSQLKPYIKEAEKALAAFDELIPPTDLSDREIATILHGLRMIQCEGRIEGCAAGDCEHFDEAEALTNEEIDTLCENLNFGGYVNA